MRQKDTNKVFICKIQVFNRGLQSIFRHMIAIIRHFESNEFLVWKRELSYDRTRLSSKGESQCANFYHYRFYYSLYSF